MANSSKSFDPDKLLPLKIDLWLIPKLDPTLLQRLIEVRGLHMVANGIHRQSQDTTPTEP